MAARARTPNTALAALITEARWSNGNLARAVNRLGDEAGLRLRYDDSSVCHWLSGTLPRLPVRPLVCEALARRLGRPVTPASAGLGPSETAPAQGGDTVARLVDLGSADMDPTRRAVLGLGLYSAALAIPGWEEVSGRFKRLRRDPHTRIGQAEVDSVRAMTDHLSTLDDQFGGRTARPLAAAFLVNTIAPYLRAHAREDIRVQMLSAAADHCYLTGYMAADEGVEGLAQRYYLQALELAGHAGDHLTYCTTLRGMSVQAVDLRHSTTAVHLADAASAASPKAGPRMRAFLAGQQAHAAAQDGNRVQALAKLREAETALDQAESRAKALGSYDTAAMSYHLSQVLYELGDLKKSVTAMEQSDRLRPPVYRRIRVRNLGTLAERKLAMGQLEEACRIWERMIDDYPSVKSGWCDRRYQAMMTELARHRRNPHARDLYQRGRALTAA
ncbi:tetratricopeptide repeat protein [Actinomadura viridis]|uniref:tetratricopeptide repeat protein n=1 Tax=Actinomadura viridis TaxID=58110 RepID=UPI00368705DA